ncbi:urease accessory protein UreD [Devosia pacifica]|uniref:Urease accessory protein UreD n=1 Tax=Devosia pacifica TaxID=1335967 RepID=A0A918RXB9_9HYPH|nr:urease accessory protein UreD [Devosia pacifica]GHA16066.1 urease accessory protein UreD [Devosia pacifica]
MSAAPVSKVQAVVRPKLQRASGIGRIGVAGGAVGTRLAKLWQQECCKIRIPRSHGHGMEAALINTSGGITGGDSLEWSATASGQAHLTATTPACEKVYRSDGADAHVAVTLRVEDTAVLNWLPQETILFEGARLNRRIEADLSADARLALLEAVVIGRSAMGERAPGAALRDQWRIRRNGKLIHAEATDLGANDTRRDARGLLAGNTAFATLVYLAPDAEKRLEMLRSLMPNSHGTAASASPGRLVVRFLAENGLALRRQIVPTIETVLGPSGLPRIWHI